MLVDVDRVFQSFLWIHLVHSSLLLGSTTLLSPESLMYIETRRMHPRGRK